MAHSRPVRRAPAPITPVRSFPWGRLLLAASALGAALVAVRAWTTAAPASPQAPTSSAASAMPGVAWYDYDIVHTYPHDRSAFTQGLLYLDGRLWESTGLEGQSTVREVELTTGRVLRETKVDAQYFAEGLASVGGRLFQLTWQSQIGLIYDRATLTTTGTFPYDGEGWGLASHGDRLVMSDGTSTLRWLDPSSLKETGRLPITEGSTAVADLNELESVKGEIFANVWQTDYLVAIDPATGRVTKRINLRGLLSPDDLQSRVDVLNGIAYDQAGDRLFVTGKWWPKLFEIRLRAR